MREQHRELRGELITYLFQPAHTTTMTVLA
jgi:hypothetical protein